MLLSLMRKNAKSWLIKLLMVIIAVVFVFYFGYSFTTQESAKVATVNGENITAQEYQTAYYDVLNNLQEQYKDAWNESLVKALDLENRVLENLIQEKIISKEAKNIGLEVTDKEIQDNISQYEAFQADGVFNNEKYNAVLSNNRTTPEVFEKSIGQTLLKQKLVQFLTSFLVISDEEVKEQYTFANEKVKISYVNFSPSDFLSSVSIDRTLMNKFFEEHKESYRIPAKIKVTYVSVSPDEFRGQVIVDEDEIKTYYEDNVDKFKEEKQVRARHILFLLPDNSTAETEKSIKEKAEKVLVKVRSGEDFEKLAKEFSEDPSTKDNGGDLGYFKKGQMVEAFETAAFSLPKGGISNLVKTAYGYHIIKVEDIKEAKTNSLQEAHDQIANLLTVNKGKELADEKLLNFIDQMPSGVDLAQYSSQKGFTTTTTDYFSEEQPIQFLEGQTKILNMIFSLQDKEISEALEINNIFYLIQVVEKKASYLPNVSEVAASVEGDYKSYLALQKSKSAAEEYLSKLKTGSDWNNLALERKKTPQVSDFFTRGDLPKGLEYMSGFHSAVFKLNQNKRYPDGVFENESGAYVVRWEEKQGIDENKFKEDRAKYVSSILSTKQQYVFNSWLQRLTEKAKIDRSSFAKNK